LVISTKSVGQQTVARLIYMQLDFYGCVGAYVCVYNVYALSFSPVHLDLLRFC